jgi:hypothetical protein
VLLAKGEREHEGHVRELLATTRWRVAREDESYVLLLRAGALQRPAKSS